MSFTDWGNPKGRDRMKKRVTISLDLDIMTWDATLRRLYAPVNKYFEMGSLVPDSITIIGKTKNVVFNFNIYNQSLSNNAHIFISEGLDDNIELWLTF
jgi:hypothetical protein